MDSFEPKKTKYFGILKNFDFEKINKYSFQILIDKGIFDESELSEGYRSETDYFGIELEDNISSFNDFFLFNRKEYNLKREVVSEMINLRNFHLVGFFKPQPIIKEIEILIEAELNIEDKIEVITNNYKLYFDMITEKEYYPLYKNNIKTNGYNTWEEYFWDEIVGLQKYASIVNYFKGDYDNFIPEPIKSNWTEYYIFSQISNYCEEKKNLLLNIRPEKMQNIETPANKIELSFQISLIEEIRNIDRNIWEELSSTKKGKLLSLLIGKNADNIRNIYYELEKKPSDKSGKYSNENSKYSKDRINAQSIVKNILG